MNRHFDRVLTVGFLPWWPDNPYQILLKRELNTLGVRVIGNPPLSLLRLMLGRDGLDVIHVHWPHGNYKTTLQLIRVLIMFIAYRLLRNNLVWTVHELDAYESRSPGRDAWFRSVVMRLSRRLIVHGEHTRQELVSRYAYKRPIDITRHPSYKGWYKNDVTREQARREFDIPNEARVYLYFGYLKPYKGVEALIESFCELTDERAILMIVGKPLNDTVVESVLALAAGDSRIRTHLGYVPADKIQNYFHAADIAVFPFRQTQTSGSLMLALTYGCPVIAPKMATIPEYVDANCAILFNPESRGDLKRALEKVAHAPLVAMAAAAAIRGEASSWAAMAAVHVNCYELVTS